MCAFLLGGSVASASSTGATAGGVQVDSTALGHPADVLDMPVDPNEPTYCLCHQVSYGEMIGCDNPDVCSIIYILTQWCFLNIFIHDFSVGTAFVSFYFLLYCF